MMGFLQGLGDDRTTIRECTAINRITANIKTCQMNLTRIILPASQAIGVERGDAVAGTEPHPVIGCTHGNALSILPGMKTVAVDISDKMFLLSLILPDTHGGATPDVA